MLHMWTGVYRCSVWCVLHVLFGCGVTTASVVSHCGMSQRHVSPWKLWDDEFNLWLHPGSLATAARRSPHGCCCDGSLKNRLSRRAKITSLSGKKQQVIFTNCWSMEWRWGTSTVLDVQRDWWITEASLCSLLVVLLQSKKEKRNKTTHPGTLIQVK